MYAQQRRQTHHPGRYETPLLADFLPESIAAGSYGDDDGITRVKKAAGNAGAENADALTGTQEGAPISLRRTGAP